MPGIVGLITHLPRASAEPQLRLMLKAISYEPFYKTDIYIDESLGVCRMDGVARLVFGWHASEKHKRRRLHGLFG